MKDFLSFLFLGGFWARLYASAWHIPSLFRHFLWANGDDGENNKSNLKDEFMEAHGERYGYSGTIDALREQQFKRLDGVCYLDHAGATLYSEEQMRAVLQDLNTQLFGNPHSQNDSSSLSSHIISSARLQVLAYCNASPKDYRCIFTSGATSALKLVGEMFPWSKNSYYVYTIENHNSVLGLREYALNQGATAVAIDIENYECLNKNETPDFDSAFVKVANIVRKHNKAGLLSPEEEKSGNTYHLFSFPLECNFSGAKFDLELVNMFQSRKFISNIDPISDTRGKCMVLLDAAKGCGSQPPDLSKYPADFVAISFYKIFGYPTGLGALIVRNGAAESLLKTYFSGGTVSAAIADIDFVRHRENIEQRFEDGTISFLSIASLRHGFNVLDHLGIQNIACHVGSLTAFTSDKLDSMRHDNGEKVCVVYGSRKKKVYMGPLCNQGPVVTFNLKRPDGTWVGYREVEKLASTRGIHLRTGCFCNPGACAKYLQLSHADIKANFETGHVCWDDADIIFGKPTGAIRVSFGYMSSFEDIEVFLNFINDFFVSKMTAYNQRFQNSLEAAFSSSKSDTIPSSANGRQCYLESITVYPIKSCAGFNVESWPLGESGLLYDREWLIMSASGDVLTQKRVPLMCSIGTLIDIQQRKLLVYFPDMKENLEIPLDENPYNNYKEEIQVCGQRVEGQIYEAQVNEWFSCALRHDCVLVRKNSDRRHCCRNSPGKLGEKLSFVNEGQLLLVSKASVEDVNSKMASICISEGNVKKGYQEVDAMRFRPNLVISGSYPYEEDQWKGVIIGKEVFNVIGGCNRCEMININPKTGYRSQREPLSTLAAYRRSKGKILFGILLVHEKTLNLPITKIKGVTKDSRIPSPEKDTQKLTSDVNSFLIGSFLSVGSIILPVHPSI